MGHLRLVDDHASCLVEGNLSLGERVPQDILRDRGLAFLVVTSQPDAVVDGKTGGVPPFHEIAYQPVVDQPYSFEQFEHSSPEEFGQWLNVCSFRHTIKDPTFVEEAIGGYGMYVGMTFGVIAKCLNRHDCPDYTLGLVECGSKKHAQTFVGRTAESRD
jgi:hypothetical protein